MSEILKRCPKCDSLKPATSEYFYTDRHKKDGLCCHCKDCQRALKPESKARISAYQRQYRIKNKEKLNEYQETYRSTHKEEAVENNRRYRSANKERIKELNRAWQAKNGRKNKDGKRAAKQRRRARQADLPSAFTKQDWQRSIDYFGGCCAACGRPMNGLFHTAAADHWIPMSDPSCPGTIVENIIPLCHGQDGCNQSKGNRPAAEWLVWKFGKRKAKTILAKIEAYFAWVR